MLSLTLDTNCILALDDVLRDSASHRKAEAEAVRLLIAAHTSGNAQVGIVAISASERQRNNGHLEHFSAFERRLASLGLDQLELLQPMLYFDVTFWDVSLWSDEEMVKLEESIHTILFPSIPFLWTDYCSKNRIAQTSETPDRKWRNAKCDVQAFWSHAWRKREVFVTSDANFHAASKKSRLLALAGGRIETPTSAVALLTDPQGAG